MAKFRRKPILRILFGVFLVVFGLAIWATSFKKGIFGGIQAGEYVPGFSIYNGSLHCWADSESSTETHFHTNDLEFLETGSDGGNEMRLFGLLDGPNSSSYKFDFDIPFWPIPCAGLGFVAMGLWARRRSKAMTDSELLTSSVTNMNTE